MRWRVEGGNIGSVEKRYTKKRVEGRQSQDVKNNLFTPHPLEKGYTSPSILAALILAIKIKNEKQSRLLSFQIQMGTYTQPLCLGNFPYSAQYLLVLTY